MVRVKQLAESQFDPSAAPISLGNRFELFCSFQLNQEDVEHEDEQSSYPFLFSDEIEEVPIPVESLILIANDLDPQTRDEFETEFSSLEIDDDFNSEITLVPQVNDELNSPIKVYQHEKIDDIDFRIKHSEIKKEIDSCTPENKVTTAFRLVNLAIDKMSDRMKRNYELDQIDSKSHGHPRRALIDKSISSINFINQLGIRMMNYYSNKFPNRFKFPLNDDSIVDWLNNHADKDKKLDFLFGCFYVASKLKFSNIELNDYPSTNYRLTGVWKYISSHQFLYLLNIHTIDIQSTKFKNFEQVVRKFPKIHGGQRLYYLEHLISQAKKKNLFFESLDETFFEKPGKRWKNEDFPMFNIWIDNWSIRSELLPSLFNSPTIY